ncbi:hypothetical protein NL676_018227 [Syzygium grande]|nr:hypothetical protein NL676_018227 [Syzygium grande]
MDGTVAAVAAASPAALGRSWSSKSFTPAALGLAGLASSSNRRERQGRREKWDGDGDVRDGIADQHVGESEANAAQEDLQRQVPDRDLQRGALST